MRKDNLVITLVMAAALLMPGQASALIVDLPDVAGQGFFQDTSTGYTWMDVDNFFGMSYLSVEAGLPPGYEVATLEQIQAMHSTLAWGDYFTWNAITGDNDRGSTRIVWGYYDIGDLNLAGESWMYSSLAFNGGDGDWNYSTLGDPPYFNPYSVVKNSPAPDRGAWVVSVGDENVIPEPTSLLLLATGIVGVIARRRGRCSNFNSPD